MIPFYAFHTIPIGPITIQVWGFFVALGILVAMIFSARVAPKRGLESKVIYDAAFWIIIGSFIGARLLYAVYNPDYIFASLWNIFKVWTGGLSIMGGFLGALAAFIGYVRKHKLQALAYADVIIFGLPFGLFIGRLGCGSIHDHIGKITTMPWGMQWIDGTIRHENGLYLSLNGLILFLIFLLLHRKKRFEGFTTSVFLMWYGLVRFFLDFLRATDLPGVSDIRFFGLTPAQYLSIVMFIAGVYLFFRFKPKKSS